MANDETITAYTFTGAARELNLSSNYIATLVERGELVETMQVKGTRERFVTAESVAVLKASRLS